MKTVWGTYSSAVYVKVVGPPGPPAGLLVEDVGQFTMGIRWMKGDSSGADIDGYVIEANNEFTSGWYILDQGIPLRYLKFFVY